jgi:hypothetical protein
MKSILKIEGYVEVPSYLKTSVSYKIAYLMKEEIRNYKWYEGEKKRDLTWEEAVSEWNAKHRAAFDRYMSSTLLSAIWLKNIHTSFSELSLELSQLHCWLYSFYEESYYKNW